MPKNLRNFPPGIDLKDEDIYGAMKSILKQANSSLASQMRILDSFSTKKLWRLLAQLTMPLAPIT